MCGEGNEAGRRTEMDEDGESWGGSSQAESHLEQEKKCWAFGVSAQTRAKERHGARGLPQDQKISRGLRKARATPVQIKGKHPDITGLELPVKH